MARAFQWHQDHEKVDDSENAQHDTGELRDRAAKAPPMTRTGS